MRDACRAALLSAALLVAPTMVQAGWVATWTNTAVKQNGDRANPEDASMSIAGGRVRLEQPEVVTVIDYNANRFTLMNPTKQYFWSGTIDEYLGEMNRARAAKLREKIGEIGSPGKMPEADHAYQPPKVDPAKLPPLSITKTSETATIAGYDTVRYEIRADGMLFQEIWVAPTLDVSSDLNFDRYLTVQRKMSAAMMGKAAGQYNALYLNEEYLKLLEKAFVLKVVTHHMAGGFERSATSVRQAEVPATQFEVPDAYRKVRFSDIMGEPQGS